VTSNIIAGHHEGDQNNRLWARLGANQHRYLASKKVAIEKKAAGQAIVLGGSWKAGASHRVTSEASWAGCCSLGTRQTSAACHIGGGDDANAPALHLIIR